MVNDKIYKKMSRRDLLEILVLQSKKIDKLINELDKVNKELKNKQIIIAESGSIAEASLKLNKIFEDAQAAADQYLDNVKRMTILDDRMQSILKKDNTYEKEI